MKRLLTGAIGRKHRSEMTRPKRLRPALHPPGWAIRRIFAISALFMLLSASLAEAGSSGKVIAIPPPASEPPPRSNPAPSVSALAEPSSAAEAQAAFVAAAVGARNLSREAANEMAKGAARAERKRLICSALRSLRVTGWTGTISTLSATSRGKGVLKLSIGPRIYVETAASDDFDFLFPPELDERTLIDPSSPMFRAAVQMKKGDKVRFSGEFIRSDVDCVREISLTLVGSLDEPDFLFRFTEIASAE